nr:methyltransferase domain-containing protein [uncultured Methanospirillum sp.]
MMDLINYNEIWRIVHQNDRSKGVDWDKRATSFFKRVSRSEEPQKVISALNLKKTDSVLDMGAGTGRFAVPIANHVSHLTALEPSSGMSSYLEKGMQDAGLTNYTLIRKRWEDVIVNQDIPLHDVVFASNSLGFSDLSAGLMKLDAAAKRAVHILWFAGKERHPMDPDLAMRLGRDGKGRFWPDYLFIMNVLHNIGIYANVSVEPIVTNQVFEDLDDAVSWLSDLNNIEPDKISIIREYLSETLKKTNDGHLSMSRSGWRARIWWEKGICAE